MENIYLDNAATSFPKAEGVSDAMKYYLDHVCANVGRGSYGRATEAGLIVLETRERIAEFFGCEDPRNVVFTAGNTMSLNLIIHGFVRRGDRILITPFEHNSVLRPLIDVGAELVRIPHNESGIILPERLPDDLSSFRACIASHCSNVSGMIQPLGELSEKLHAFGIPLIVDAAQSAGHFLFTMQDIGADAVTLPAHKGLRAAQGLGLLLLSSGFAELLKPFLTGGTGSASHSAQMPQFMPDRFEAGTLNLPGIYGLHKALETFDPKRTRSIELRQIRRFLDGIQTMPHVRLLGSLTPEDRVSVFSLDFIGKDNAEIAFLLEDRYGLLTRCGLHCSPEAHKALGTYPQGTVRFSFSEHTTDAEIDYATEAICSCK